MCGICGVAGRPVSAAALRGATELLRHRGPDDEGYFCDDLVSLGMRRLKVIDLAGGAQPKTNESGSIQLVFNGEIYNYRDLRLELMRRGHVFQSDSDTEVVVHAYEEWGTDSFGRLNGIFAFAIWDSGRAELVLARDHVGIKPLFYCHRQTELVFGSELKPVLALLPTIPEIDPASFGLYLRFRYVPSPHSILDGVRKLPAGHHLTFRAEDGGVSIERYWDPLSFTEKGAQISPAEAEERVGEAIKSAVKRQLVSDVPVGAFLSGGIDSSTVVAMMSEVANETPSTFSIGFAEHEVDESRYARKVAEHFGTRHHERIVTAGEAREVLPQLQTFFDEPFADASAIPTYLVSQLAREQVTVSLSGDGGDELFGGYDRYWALKGARGAWALPTQARAAAMRVARRVPGRIGALARAHGDVFRAPNLSTAYRSAVSSVRDPSLRLMTPAAVEAMDADQWPESIFHERPLIEAMMLTDLVTYLPDDILTKLDRASMAWSLEARVPLLDRQLVELLLALPVSSRTGNSGKDLLKRVLRRKLPSSLVDRPKMGFGIPIHDWLRGELYESLRDHLAARSVAHLGLLNPDPIDRLVEEHKTARANHGHALWTIYMFQIWYASFYAPAVSRRDRAS